MTTAALIVAAGTGSRSGSALPKQFAVLAGRAMLAWSYEALAAHPAIDRVLVHDAARPYVPAAVVDRLLAALDAADGALPVVPVADR